jgi:hypothetical protein
MGWYLDIAHETASIAVSTSQYGAYAMHNEKSELCEGIPDTVRLEACHDEVDHHREDRLTYPAGPCSTCGSIQYWQRPGEPWRCRVCEPDMPLQATSITLPCHEARHEPVRNAARQRTMVEVARRRLSITPKQLWRELKQAGDLADVERAQSHPKPCA